MRLCTTLANPGEQIHHCNEDIGHCSGEIHLLRAIYPIAVQFFIESEKKTNDSSRKSNESEKIVTESSRFFIIVLKELS